MWDIYNFASAQVVDSGIMTAKSALGQQFSRECKKDISLADRYKMVGKTYAAQNKFRLDWVQEVYKNHIKSKQHNSSITTSSGDFGQYKPFAVIWADEGKDKARLRATVNIVKNQMKLMKNGKLLNNEHPWYRWNKLSERMEFMHLRTSFQSLYQEEWKTTESWDDKGAASTSTTLPVADVPCSSTGPENPTPQKLPCAKRAASVDSHQGDKQPDKHKKKIRTEFDIQCTEVTKLKGKYQKNLQVCQDLMQIIQTDGKWQWARNDYVLSPLKEVSAGSKILVFALIRKKNTQDQKQV